MVGSIKNLVVEDFWPRSVPEGGWIVITPDDAFVGTTARIVVLLEMIINGEVTPPNCTIGIPVKFVPWMITFVLGRPLLGEKVRIPGRTKKFVAVATELVMRFVAVLKLPILPWRMSGPVVTPLGALTSISLSLTR